MARTLFTFFVVLFFTIGNNKSLEQAESYEQTKPQRFANNYPGSNNTVFDDPCKIDDISLNSDDNDAEHLCDMYGDVWDEYGE
jgi:hypothetical protein